MVDVYIVALSIIGVWISSTGMLMLLNFMLPKQMGIAADRLTKTPWKSFFMGLGITLITAFFVSAATNGGGLAKGLGVIIGLFTVGLWSIGGAAFSGIISEKIAEITSSDNRMKNLLRGSILTVVAGFVPLIGWFVFIPLVGLAEIGASFFAVFGWEPKSTVETEPEYTFAPGDEIVEHEA